MTNKTTSTFASHIQKTSRLEPRYFYNQKLLQKTFDKYGYEEFQNFVTLKSGSTPEHFDERKNKTDFHFIKSADIKRYILNFSTISFVNDQIHKARKTFKVLPDDVLLSNTGKYLGFACIVPKEIPEASTNQNIVRIRFKEKAITKFNPFFILSFLNSLFGQIEIESLLTLTGQKYLNMEKLKEFKVPKIDSKNIESITEKTQKVFNNELEANLIFQDVKDLFYRELGVDFSKIRKQKCYSVNLKTFSNDDLWTPAFSYPLYVNTQKAISQKWKIVTLGEIATAKKGNEVGSENYINYIDKKSSDVPFIRTTDLVNHEADLFPDFFVSDEIFKEFNQDIRPGDILFNNDGKIGYLAVLTPQDRVIIQSHIKRIRLKGDAKNHNITPEYLFLVLTIKEIGGYQAEKFKVIQSTIPTISNRTLDIQIPILDKDIINQITISLKKVFELKDQKKKMIDEIRREINSYYIINL